MAITAQFNDTIAIEPNKPIALDKLKQLKSKLYRQVILMSYRS